MIAERTVAKRLVRAVSSVWHDLRPIAPHGASLDDRNIKCLYGEIGWVAVLSGVITFNAPYALRLGASNAEIGLLASLPALMAILVTIPAGAFLNKARGSTVRALTWTLFANRIGYVLAALVPVLAVGHPSLLAIGIFVVFSAPGHFYNVGWNALLADVTPEHWRAKVFARRSIILSVVSTVSVFVSGRWLSYAPFPQSYQVLYLVGFVAALVSLYYVNKLRPLPREADGLGEPQVFSLRNEAADLACKLRAEPQFVRIVINTLAHGMGVWLAGPVYVLFYVRTLHAQEAWLGVNGMVATLAPVMGFYLWQRIIGVRGERWVLRLTIMLLWLYPFLVGLTYNLSIILVWSALYGLVAPGVTLSHFNMLLKVIPNAHRPLFMAVYITVMNLGAFVMPLLGAWLAERIAPGPTLVLGGVLCVLGSSLFLFRPITAPDSLIARMAAASHKQ